MIECSFMWLVASFLVFPAGGLSLLQLAAQYGHHSSIKVLLQGPLHMVASDGHSIISDLLVRVKRDIFCMYVYEIVFNMMSKFFWDSGLE